MRAIPTFRSACLVGSLVLAATLFVPAVVGATQTSTANPVAGHDTTRRASVASTGYSTSLFLKIPLPALATAIAKPTTPLQPVSGSLGLAHTADVTRYFTLASSFDVAGFAKSHFPSSQWQGESSTTDGGYRVSSSFSKLPLCRNRHAAYCGVTYTTGSLGAGRQELRVDVAVVWLPVHVVYLPASGVVTLTGYATISLMNRSSGPVVVTETSSPRSAKTTSTTSVTNFVDSMKRANGATFVATYQVENFTFFQSGTIVVAQIPSPPGTKPTTNADGYSGSGRYAYLYHGAKGRVAQWIKIGTNVSACMTRPRHTSYGALQCSRPSPYLPSNGFAMQDTGFVPTYVLQELVGTKSPKPLTITTHESKRFGPLRLSLIHISEPTRQ